MYSWSMACCSHGLDNKPTDCVLMWPCGPIPLSVNGSVYICYKSKPGVSMAKIITVRIQFYFAGNQGK